MLTKERILIFSPIALAVMAGVCAVLITGVGNADFVDSVDYLAAAKMIAEQGQYPDVGSLPFFRAPLYPGFMALVWSIVPGSILAIKVIQVALFAASAWISGKTLRLITKNAWMAFAGSMIFAANPFFAFEAAAIQTECLQIFLLSTAFYLIVRLLTADRFELTAALPLGIVLGLASLNKPSVLGATLVIAAAIWFLKRKAVNSVYASVAIVALAFVTILPWSLFVYQTKGQFFLVNDAGGYNAWSGNLPESVKYYETTFTTTADAAAWGEDLAKVQMDQWEAAGGYSNLSLKQREALWTAKAIENVEGQPGTIAKLWGYKFLSFWKPFVSSSIYSPRAVALSAVVMVPLFVFGFLGLAEILKAPTTSPVGWMFVVLAVFATAVHVALVANLRLRLPYIDPWLAMFAGVSVCDLAYRFFRSPATATGLSNLEPAAI